MMFCAAVKRKNETELEVLAAEAELSLDNSTQMDASEALVWAVQHDHMQCCRILLNLGDFLRPATRYSTSQWQGDNTVILARHGEGGRKFYYLNSYDINYSYGQLNSFFSGSVNYYYKCNSAIFDLLAEVIRFSSYYKNYLASREWTDETLAPIRDGFLQAAFIQAEKLSKAPYLLTRPMYEIGLVYHRLNQDEKALECFKRAAARGHGLSIQACIRYYMKQKQYADVLAYLEEAAISLEYLEYWRMIIGATRDEGQRARLSEKMAARAVLYYVSFYRGKIPSPLKNESALITPDQKSLVDLVKTALTSLTSAKHEELDSAVIPLFLKLENQLHAQDVQLFYCLRALILHVKDLVLARKILAVLEAIATKAESGEESIREYSRAMLNIYQLGWGAIKPDPAKAREWRAINVQEGDSAATRAYAQELRAKSYLSALMWAFEMQRKIGDNVEGINLTDFMPIMLAKTEKEGWIYEIVSTLHDGSLTGAGEAKALSSSSWSLFGKSKAETEWEQIFSILKKHKNDSKQMITALTSLATKELEVIRQLVLANIYRKSSLIPQMIDALKKAHKAALAKTSLLSADITTAILLRKRCRRMLKAAEAYAALAACYNDEAKNTQDAADKTNYLNKAASACAQLAEVKSADSKSAERAVSSSSSSSVSSSSSSALSPPIPPDAFVPYWAGEEGDDKKMDIHVSTTTMGPGRTLFFPTVVTTLTSVPVPPLPPSSVVDNLGSGEERSNFAGEGKAEVRTGDHPTVPPAIVAAATVVTPSEPSPPGSPIHQPGSPSNRTRIVLKTDYSDPGVEKQKQASSKRLAVIV